ncbi:MAG: SIR2 family protein [Eubacteriales bacterium]|nr:SIR2 family protein [Eubacteriales bacterium]
MISNKGKLQYKEERRLIRKACEEKKLVLFVGAGVSRYSSMPGWRAAIEEIKKCLYMSSDEHQEDYLKIPQMYYNARGAKEYTELMRKIFRYRTRMETNAIHKKLIAFNTHTIITTNYDSLLEIAAGENGEFIQTIACDTDMPYKTAEKEIIKMHGDFEHNNFVLKEDDYLNYSENFKLIETYIKALIGGNVVFFVGYSFSDPDIKQIFTWVKSILGKNFQRAYMVETFQKYNQNDYDYYKNLGINMIYADQCVDDFKKEKAEEYLNDILDYILQEENSDNIIDCVYDYLKPFADLNYTMQPYITKAFRSVGICADDNELMPYNIESTDSDAARLMTLLQNDSAGEVETAEKVKTIQEILVKSSILKLSVCEKRKEGGYNEISKNIMQVELPQRIRAVFEFDQQAMRQQIDQNEMYLGDDAQMHLRQAWMYFQLYMYTKAYFCIKKASSIFLRKNQYAWYFISEFNRYYVGQLISNSFQVSITAEEKAQIEREYKAIDLNKTFSRMPNLGNNWNEFLKDFQTFRFCYTTLRSAYDISQKMEKEAKTNYFAYGGTPEYEKMQNLIKDFWLYQEQNYMMLDNYREVTEIYKLYAKSVLASAGTEDMCVEEGMFMQEATFNVHKEKLDEFDLFVILRYLSAQDLENFIRQYEIEHIDITEEGIEYLKKIFSNLAVHKNCMGKNSILWTFLKIVCLVKIDSDMADGIVETVSKAVRWQEAYSQRTDILDFVYKNYNERPKQRRSKNEHNKPVLEKFLDTLIEKTLQVPYGKTESHAFEQLIKVVAQIYQKIYGGYDNKMIKELIEQRRYSTIVKLYSSCVKKWQTTIRDVCSRWDGKVDAANIDLYADMVRGGIINPVEAYERKVLGSLDLLKQQSKGVYPNQYEEVLSCMVNLYLDDKILLKEQFVQVFQTAEKKLVRCLANIHDFDYREFDLQWLNHFGKKLLEELAADENAGPEIRQKFRREYLDGLLDKSLMRIYFENFA